MKITLAVLAALLAGPVSAQVVKRAAPAPAVPVAPVKTAVESLFERLVRDGATLDTPTGVHLYLETRRRGSETAALAASVREFPVPEQEGASRLVMRRIFSGVVEITEQDRVETKAGEGTIDSRTFVVALDGRLVSVVGTKIPYATAKDGTLVLDQEKAATKSEDPRSAETLERWKAVEKELPFIAKTVEA